MGVHSDVGLVFVHGAGLGGWIWDEMSGVLQAPHVFADFPARDRGEQDRQELRLADYAAHVVEQAAGLPAERLVVVAHSLGGVVGLKVADQLGARLAGFVGISAAIPANGGSFVSSLPAPKRWIVGTLMRVFGTKPPESAIRKGMCNDLSDDQADQVVRRFVPEGRAVYFERTDAPRPAAPRRYVRLTDDHEFDQETQRAMAANLGTEDVRELSSGHLPMLSKPKELAELLNEFVAELDE